MSLNFERRKIINGQTANSLWVSSFTDSWSEDVSSNVMSVTLTDGDPNGESSNVQLPISQFFDVIDEHPTKITGIVLRYNVGTTALASAPSATFYDYTVGGSASSTSTNASGTGTAKASDYDAVYTISDSDDYIEIEEDKEVNVKFAFETGDGSVVKVYSIEILYESV